MVTTQILYTHEMKMCFLQLIIPFLLFFLSFFQHSSQQALVTPVTKDDTTKLYAISIYLKTPLQPSKLQLDLGSYFPWYDCARHYKSSSYKRVPANSTLCHLLETGISINCAEPPPKVIVEPSCFYDETCAFGPNNPVTGKGALGPMITDKFALPTANNPRLPGPVSELLLSCTFPFTKIFKGLAKGSTGVAPMGRFNYSLPAQLSRSFSSPLIFAVCLPGSSTGQGVALFNSPGPYYFSPGRINLSQSLIYTPLISGVKTPIILYKSPDYYIGLTSLKVNSLVVPLNKTLLAIDENGIGGVKLSTYTPYTLLQTSVYKALVNAFVKEATALNLTVTTAVKPFGVCYAADKITNTRVGPAVPTIDLVLHSDKVAWRIYGSNSMVKVDDKWCLGFVDGGLNPTTYIVIGGHQLEDNLLQFDLVRERLGFSSSLLFRSTTCSNFDSTKI